MERLLGLNHDFLGRAAFSVAKGGIVFLTAGRPVEDLDPGEIIDLILWTSEQADHFDDVSPLRIRLRARVLSDPESKPQRKSSDRTIRSMARIASYYGLLISIFAVLIWAFPWFSKAVTRTQAEGGISDAITDTFGGVPLTDGVVVGGLEGLAVDGISLLGALLIMIPVAWTYIIIKRRSGYDQSVVHTLIILPVAVTGIVIIVKTSVALAFSLAGIVAAVRFRTTLEDTKDAVYVFLAIGVGLAAGDQRLGTALLASIVFNVVNLVLMEDELRQHLRGSTQAYVGAGAGGCACGAPVGGDRPHNR